MPIYRRVKMDIANRVVRVLKLTNDFFAHIPESSLTQNIPNAPSNSIGEQAWCIIGARESYLKALREGRWAGFSCSLHDHTVKNAVMGKLEGSTADIQSFLQTATQSVNWDLAVDLLEHEVQHHGQLIRYAYANRLEFPESWTRRYTVR